MQIPATHAVDARITDTAAIADTVSDANSIINTEHAHTLTTQEATIDSAVM